eukprot:TRINITY_DN12749_c0_g1_i4.p1 TRINITY_DN12749_c0_g1~~TRINITY_DN12749_c0_g1_i4.p1  ORF type:complete len:119 (+),score=34.54 TRINITY_DN12749_c0_g1_i4:129-485(+)
MLHEVIPYVTYGILSRDMISALIHKKGHMRKEAQVLPISNNQVVEDLLGTQGIICIEDIVHSLASADKSVDKVLGCLCPFKLSKPKEGALKKNRQPFGKGGDWGNRRCEINELVKQMI